MATAYVHKTGGDYIGWTDVGGRYEQQETRRWPTAAACRHSGSSTPPNDRRFLLTNPAEYSLDLQRSRDSRRKTTRAWMAGLRLIHVFEGDWPPGVERDDCRGRAVELSGAAQRAVRPRPQRSNQCARPAGKRSTARVSRHGHASTFREPACRSRATSSTSAASPGRLRRRSTCRKGRSASCSSPAARAGCRRRSLLDLRLSRMFSFGGSGRVELLLDVLNVLNRRSGRRPHDRQCCYRA